MNRARTPAEIAQGRIQEEIVEESFQAIGKAAKGVFDFLTSENDEEFLQKVDARHGSNLGELHRMIKDKAGKAASAIDQVRERANAEVRGELPSSSSSSSSRPNAPHLAGADEVVVMLIDDPEPEPCEFCRGKQVVSMHAKTRERKPIPCPECKANPSATPDGRKA